MQIQLHNQMPMWGEDFSLSFELVDEMDDPDGNRDSEWWQWRIQMS